MSRVTEAAAAPTSDKLSVYARRPACTFPFYLLLYLQRCSLCLLLELFQRRHASQLEKLRPCSFFLSNSAARRSIGLLNRAKMQPLCPFNTGGIRTSPNGGPRTVSFNVLYGADRLSLSCLANSELISWINVSATNQLWATVTLTSHCLFRHG